MQPETLARLRKVSSPTLCTQLFKRGFRNVYIQGIHRLTTPTIGDLVGPAYAMRNAPAREDLDQISAFENPEHPQRKGVESARQGHVLVVDTRGVKRGLRRANAHHTLVGARCGGPGIGWSGARQRCNRQNGFSGVLREW